MIGTCAGQAIELKTMPFDLVSRTVQPNDAQRSALEQVRSRANEAAATLSATCPKDIPAELGRQLDQLGKSLRVASLVASSAVARHFSARARQVSAWGVILSGCLCATLKSEG